MKHAVQLLVLLAVSIWLLFQLKHTFDKKHSVDASVNNPDESSITANEETIPERTTKLGRKDLPQYIENNSNKEGDNDVDEEDEERDTELEQLLEDVETRENEQEDSEENGEDREDEIVDGEYNGEEDEEGNTDGDGNSDANEIEEKGTLPSVNIASISVQSDSASNQTVSVNLSINQESNSTTNVEVKEEVGKPDLQDALHANANQASSVQAANETTSDTIPYLSTKVEGNRDGIKEA
jgi:hypothetical protein